jgi:four helix bundle protein
MAEQKYDLEDRLLDYSVRIIRLVEEMPTTRAGNHVGGQLLRSGTSPLFNHGEAESAESPRDFVHKLRVCLKELRESRRALRLVEAVRL